MVKELKILVLGNDPQINQINFGRLDPSVITLGVNRIWLKHIPNFFFFNDFEILKELEMQPEVVKALVSKSQCFSSDWLNHSRKIKNLPDWVKVHDRPNKKSLPDSVTSAISIFKSHYLNYRKATFYVAGVSLKWTNPSHFWKELDYDSLNKHDETWYDPRFKLMLENFKNLSTKNNSMVSVHPDSLLNKYYRYEGIENLYVN